MDKYILIVEDEKRLRDLLRDYLAKEGYHVDLASHGEEGLHMALEKDYDLILLDVMMPFMNGFDMLKELRKKKSTRVFYITAKTMDEDFVKAYEIGADDFISKPFSPKILVMKIGNLFKRLEQEDTLQEELIFGRMTLHTGAQRVYVDASEVFLTKKEFELLLLFTQNKDLVLSREMILEKVWGYDYEGDLRAIDTSIKRLREKLQTAAAYVETVRGYGYRFRVSDDV
ncbi:response regulator transcription factor [Proteiniclasticum sp.]|uniref:response regulator transcription factor n=1 Tax=Proteiniclasticum sp. TaxID=2053595 RepID=UPI00289750BD|nr:response regulator transcription factor [Proteiniclasticum sp.]